MLLRPKDPTVRLTLIIASFLVVGLGVLLTTRKEYPPRTGSGGITPWSPAPALSSPEVVPALPEVPPSLIPDGARVIPLESFPDDPRLDSVGRMLKSGQYAAAEVACRTVLKDRPDIGRAEFLLGLAITKQKRYEEAKPHFRAALATDQQFLERMHAAHFLGWCHYHLGEMPEARVRFEEHLALVPEESDSLFALAVVSIAEDRIEDAERLLAQAFVGFGEGKPRDQARVLVRQSDLALRRDDAIKAEELLAKAATLAPTFPEIWAKTARVKDRLGKSEQAEIARTNERTLREKLSGSSEGGA